MDGVRASLTATAVILRPLAISGAPLLAYELALAAALWVVIAAVAAANRGGARDGGSRGKRPEGNDARHSRGGAAVERRAERIARASTPPRRFPACESGFAALCRYGPADSAQRSRPTRGQASPQ